MNSNAPATSRKGTVHLHPVLDLLFIVIYTASLVSFMISRQSFSSRLFVKMKLAPQLLPLSDFLFSPWIPVNSIFRRSFSVRQFCGSGLDSDLLALNPDCESRSGSRRAKMTVNLYDIPLLLYTIFRIVVPGSGTLGCTAPACP
jgi:hypothetical protein